MNDPWVLKLTPQSSQRNLNNAFAYDLVPSPSVITAALKAARRVNDFPTAVRIFEGKGTRFLLLSGQFIFLCPLLPFLSPYLLILPFVILFPPTPTYPSPSTALPPAH